MKKLLMLATVVLISGAVCLAEDNPAIKADLDQLQGEWTMTLGSADGYIIPDEMKRTFKRVCQGDELTVKNGDQIMMKAKITIDPSKNPKTIDYQVLEGPTKGEKHLGIYELEGDTLKSCFGAPGLERPTDYTCKQGDNRTSSVWQRDKKQN